MAYALLYLIPIGMALVLLYYCSVRYQKHRGAGYATTREVVGDYLRSAFSTVLAGIEVEQLRATVDSKDGTVMVTWQPPLCIRIPRGLFITQYEIRFKQVKVGMFWIDHPHQTLYVNAGTTWIIITRERGLKPLEKYVFDVRAVTSSGAVGKWSSLSLFVDWRCRLPHCEWNRLKKSCGTIYDFCSRDHYKDFAAKYCLYPECCNLKSAGDFCERHLQPAIESRFAAVVELESNTEEFGKVTDKFKKNWSKSKGPCPRISTILRIVNPALSERYKKFHRRLSWWYQGTKQYYHGTKLSCDITTYLELCNRDSCGICGISRQGFDPNRISRNHWQRFGRGFYLAPNSSKSHDYPLHGRNSSCSSGTGMRGLLLCDVAPGRRYSLRYDEPNLQGPPEGYDSVHGKRKFLGYFGDLNYDEVVVFNPHAIFPHYIILY